MFKRSKYFFLLIYGLVVLPIASLSLGGFYFLIVPLTVFVLIPVIDFMVYDSHNPTTEETTKLAKDYFYHHILFLYVPIHIILIIGSMVYLSIYLISTVEFIMLSIMVGIITGSIGINISHELMHKSRKWDQLTSRILLVMVCYGHFIIEHVRGHHVNVATPNDPATARMNESIYRFLPRVIIMSWLSAWHIQSLQLKRQGKPIYHWQNEFYWIIGGPLLVSCIAYSIAGWLAVIFFFLQSIVAILMLEIVNYIEHYGLMRHKLENSQYEPMSTKYSWDADNWLSNRILFNLMRHADHHTHGAKPYQTLLLSKDSPKLPASYATLYWLVIIPPLWFAVMNPIVKKHQQLSGQPHIAS